MPQNELKKQVLAILSRSPEFTNKQLYNIFPNANKNSIRCYKALFKNAKKGVSNKPVTKKEKVTKKTKNKSQSSPPLDTIDKEFIDNPNELLLSVAIRELNKQNPDPRWATILINCKKEKITTKEDVLEQFRQLPTQALVNILSKNLREGQELESHQP